MFCFIYGSFGISRYRFSNGEGTLCNNDILFVLISCLERQYPIIPVSFFISTTWQKIIFIYAGTGNDMQGNSKVLWSK